MAKITEDSLYQEQKQTKPKIEDIAPNFISKKLINNLLDFLSFLKLNKIGSIIWASANSWSVSYKSKRVCYIKIVEKSWRVIPYGKKEANIFDSEYEDYISNKNLIETVWKNIKFCRKCSPGCSPGSTYTIIGKSFNNVCHSNLLFVNPEGDNLDCVKQLVLWRQKLIAENKIPKVNYVAKNKR